MTPKSYVFDIERVSFNFLRIGTLRSGPPPRGAKNAEADHPGLHRHQNREANHTPKNHYTIDPSGLWYLVNLFSFQIFLAMLNS